MGHITVGRRYYACAGCGRKRTPWDDWAGVDQKHKITPHARRMIVLAGSSVSFDESSRNLLELARLSVSNDLVRRVCDEEGGKIQKWLNESSEPAEVFTEAEGVVEFSTDGLKINTVDGWREIRQSVISKRPPTLPATADQWDQRTLEEPTARIAVCGIAHCDRIGSSWERLVKAAGLPRDCDLSVIADGAKWIWDQAAKRFTGRSVQWVVDIYHVMLYFHAVAKTLTKQDTEKWVDDRVTELIGMGGVKFIESLTVAGPPESSAETAEAWHKLLNYLGDNRDSLWYGQRLKEGLPIGSGLIEGAGKNTLARRLKINSARWRIRRAERMGAIRCLQYSDLWETYWESKQAA